MTGPAHDVTRGPTDEAVTLAGIAALATGSATIVSKVQDHLAKQPFVAQVLDSYFREATHVILLKLHNHGSDALYVESCAVDDAKGVLFRRRGDSDVGDTWSSGSAPPSPFPFRVGPEGSTLLELRIPDKEVAERFASAIFTIARLGEKDDEERKVVMRLRVSDR